ncbi:DinB family protein [bacterium]|nr:DinB family protein [bacterium]
MKQELLRQARVTGLMIRRDLEGVEESHSRVTPPTGGNHMNWVLGHLIKSYDSAVSLLGGESLWTKDAGEAYARGSSGTTAADGPSWERLLDDFEAVEKRFQASLSGIDESGLQDKAPYSPFDDPQETLGSLLGFLLLHQAYHAGQIGLLRRVAGLEGAIK